MSDRIDKGQRTIDWLELTYRLHTRRRASELLSISLATLHRWEAGWKATDDKLDKKFHAIIADRIEQMEKHGDDLEKSMAKQAKRRLTEMAGVVTSPALTKRQRVNHIIYELCAERRVLYSEVANVTKREGISVALLGMESDFMGVIKDKRGVGRRTYSIWYLPVDGLKKRQDSELVMELEQAEELLKDTLPCEFRDLVKAARREQIGEKVLDMAAVGLNVKRSDGMAADSWWDWTDLLKE